MNDKIKFSVIMPFYFSEDYIERAILSVYNQSYENWELILINDGSKDRSQEIAEKYSNKDKRIAIYIKNNGGYATAVNHGLNRLSDDSDYFLVMGSDDELERDLFKNIVKKIKGNLPDIVGFVTTQIDEHGNKEILDSTVPNKDICVFNTDLFSFYRNNPELSELFVVRDTSRLFKTSKLGSLRYFGKYGISADGIFSSMFSYRCSSFAHFRINGYIWHIRANSVSGSIDDIKRLDSLSNWKKYFDYIIENRLRLTKDSLYYPKVFWNSYKYFVHSPFRINKKTYSVLSSCKHTLIRIGKIFKIPFGKHSSFTINFPRLFNLVYRIYYFLKHKNN